MRTCLTHPGAGAVLRDEVMSGRLGAVARAVQDEDAALRAGLFPACMVGLGTARHLIGVEPLASAAREDVERLFLPALRALLAPDDAA